MIESSDEQLPSAGGIGDDAGPLTRGEETGQTAIPAPDVEPARNAPTEALARVRAVARGRGLRPGMKPRRRNLVDPKSRDGGRDPVLLGDQLEALVAERAWQAEVAVGAVVGRWAQIVGPEIAQHTAATDFTDGILTIRADSTAWATQLRLLTSTLLTRLAGEVGEGVVAELRIVGPSAPSWSRGYLRAPGGRGPRDTYG